MAELTGVHDLQAKAEGVEIVGGGRRVDFMGDSYLIAEKVRRAA